MLVDNGGFLGWAGDNNQSTHHGGGYGVDPNHDEILHIDMCGQGWILAIEGQCSTRLQDCQGLRWGNAAPGYNIAMAIDGAMQHHATILPRP